MLLGVFTGLFFRGYSRGVNSFYALWVISLSARRRENGGGATRLCVTAVGSIHNRVGGEERRERRGFRSSPPNLESDFHQCFDKI